MKKIKGLAALVLILAIGCSSQGMNYEAQTLLKNIRRVEEIYNLKPGDSYHVFVPEKEANFFYILINKKEEGRIRTNVIIYEDSDRNGYYEKRRTITPHTPEELEEQLKNLFKNQTPRQEITDLI